MERQTRERLIRIASMPLFILGSVAISACSEEVKSPPLHEKNPAEQDSKDIQREISDYIYKLHYGEKPSE